MNDVIKLVLIIALVVFLVAIGPILTIWALNTLFPVLAIPFTIETWASVVLLGAFLKGSVTYKK
jgi:hypothetical protein